MGTSHSFGTKILIALIKFYQVKIAVVLCQPNSLVMVLKGALKVLSSSD